MEQTNKESDTPGTGGTKFEMNFAPTLDDIYPFSETLYPLLESSMRTTIMWHDVRDNDIWRGTHIERNDNE